MPVPLLSGVTQVYYQFGRYSKMVSRLGAFWRRSGQFGQLGKIAGAWVIRAIEAIGVIVLGIVIYVLSIRPVMKAVGGPFKMPPSLGTFYHPLGILMEQNGKPAVLLRTYINFCGVRNNPKTGQLLD